MTPPLCQNNPEDPHMHSMRLPTLHGSSRPAMRCAPSAGNLRRPGDAMQMCTYQCELSEVPRSQGAPAYGQPPPRKVRCDFEELCKTLGYK